MSDKFPFAFDFTAMADAMKMPGLEKLMPKDFPAFDFGAIQEAQQKNMAALIEANKAVFAGYQSACQRQVQMFEAALADTKDRVAAAQGKPLNAETAQENYETMKTAFEKAIADLKEVSDMAQAANTDAFEIIKARTEEAFGEFKAASEKFVN